jgi:hypothetical protein
MSPVDEIRESGAEAGECPAGEPAGPPPVGPDWAWDDMLIGAGLLVLVYWIVAVIVGG